LRTMLAVARRWFVFFMSFSPKGKNQTVGETRYLL
jgi:hypothetical protein